MEPTTPQFIDNTGDYYKNLGVLGDSKPRVKSEVLDPLRDFSNLPKNVEPTLRAWMTWTVDQRKAKVKEIATPIPSLKDTGDLAKEMFAERTRARWIALNFIMQEESRRIGTGGDAEVAYIAFRGLFNLKEK